MSKKKLGESEATGWERTGTDTFNVKHDDGSVFECKIDDPKKFNAFKGLKNNGAKITGFHGIGNKKPLICGVCNQQVHKITYKDGKYYCSNCI